MQLIRRFLRTIGQVRRSLNILLGISVVLILCIEFWWKHEPAMYGWRDAKEGADLAVNFLLSYVASYIFFFVGDHWESAVSREHIEPSVRKRLSWMLISLGGALHQSYLAKAYTTHAGTSLREIDDSQWRKIIVELFWKPPDRDTKKNAFTEHNRCWIMFADFAEEHCNTIIDEFGTYDPELNRLLDDIRMTCHGLKHLEEVNTYYGKVGTREDYQTRDGREAPYVVLSKSDNIFEMIKLADALVRYIERRYGGRPEFAVFLHQCRNTLDYEGASPQR